MKQKYISEATAKIHYKKRTAAKVSRITGTI